MARCEGLKHGEKDDVSRIEENGRCASAGAHRVAKSPFGQLCVDRWRRLSVHCLQTYRITPPRLVFDMILHQSGVVTGRYLLIDSH